MSAWLEYKDEDKSHDDEHEQEDAFPTARVSLIAMQEVKRISLHLDKPIGEFYGVNILRRNIELFHRFLYMQCGLLNIILHTV